MNNEIIVPELNEKTIETMIYEIRGQRVMLDFDLAKIYGYTTKAFNQQVKNNISKFDEDFIFQLSKDEFKIILMLKNSTSSWGGVRKLPYAFTEQGIAMLSGVLPSISLASFPVALISPVFLHRLSNTVCYCLYLKTLLPL